MERTPCGKKMEPVAEASSPNLKSKTKSRYKKIIRTYKKKGVISVNDANSDCYKYLIRIMDVIDSVRNDSYEMEILAQNVFEEIKGNEVLYAKVRATAQLLQDLLPYASQEYFQKFIQPFMENLRPVCMHGVASHVVQSIVTELQRRQSTDQKSDEEKVPIFCFEAFLKIAKFTLNNLENFMWNSSSNHVIRTVLSALGHFIAENVQSQESEPSISTSVQSVLIKYVDIIIMLPQFRELCFQTLTSGLLQTLLISTKNLKNVIKTLVKKIINEFKSDAPDLKDENSEGILRLVEVMVEVANEKQFKKIYKVFFKNDLKELSVSRSGNFGVQKLIRHCCNKEFFEVIFDDILLVASEVFEAGNTGVLLELAKSCVRFKTKQGEYVKMMMHILKCKKTLNEDSDITPLTCCMVTSNDYNPETMEINLHGTLIVQTMLNFGKPIKIINSLLQMEIKYLLQVVCDPRGCHIIDALIQSPYVGEKSRDKLFRALQGHYTHLATSKYGSRALDAIWSGVTTKSRVALMEELKQNESELTSNQFGKLFASKKYLNHFRRNKEEWIKRERTLFTAEKCFSDIIPMKKPKLTE